MNGKFGKLIVEFDEDFVDTYTEWKKECWSIYGMGGLKKRVQEIIREDYQMILKKKKENKSDK
ncbi:MAG: hypothetical protein ACTSXD_07125 [Candidatus Heimdallarchaeaceae archaeon]